MSYSLDVDLRTNIKRHVLSTCSKVRKTIIGSTVNTLEGPYMIIYIGGVIFSHFDIEFNIHVLSLNYDKDMAVTLIWIW